MVHVVTGNVALDTTLTRGWLIGNFIAPDDLRHDEHVEIKWGVHAAGEGRHEWAEPTHARSLGLLVSGNFTIQFPEHDINLAKPGDYILYDRTLAHRWRANEDTIIVTVRWLAR